jgi:hypothetical protein
MQFVALTRRSLPILLLFFLPNLYGQEIHKVTSLFDGQSLSGWKILPETDTSLWRVMEGNITGGDGVNRVPRSSYLYTEEEYSDFEFSCLFRLTGDRETGMINSGIQYRSIIKEGKMTGYQADIGEGFWGDIYDEHRRKKLTRGDLSTLQLLLNKQGWNSYIIRCKGNRHELYINGIKTCEYIEQDAQIPSRGVFAIQLHSGGKAKIEVRDIMITELE